MKRHRWLWILGLILASCSRSKDPPPELPFLEPQENLLVEMFGVEYLFSDSAEVVAKLTAGVMKERILEEEKRTRHELSGGVKVEMYDRRGQVNGVIQSDSAWFFKEDKEALLYGNVSIVNSKRERLQTDMLTWSQKKDSVYTDRPVRIKTLGQEIYAREGMRGTSDFSAYQLYGTSGEVEIEDP